jgi:hypothetical protein
MDHGDSLKLDTGLVQECKVIEAKIPITLYSKIHREILRSQSFDALIKTRDRIWRDVQVRYGLTKIIQREVAGVLLATTESLMSVNSFELPTIAPVRYATKLLTRMVHLFREYVSHQDACQLLKIDEAICAYETQWGVKAAGSFDTVALRISIMQVKGMKTGFK